jgi:hypothetical protein
MFVFPLADQLNANLTATNEAVFCETKKKKLFKKPSAL